MIFKSSSIESYVTDGTESTQTQVSAGKTAGPEQKCENL